MPRTRSQVAFRFLDLPAELRNNVFQLLAHDKSEVQRFVLKDRSAGGTKSKAKFLVPLAQVSKQLRNEYLPLWTSHLHAGLASIDLDCFLKTFCRGPGSTYTLCPQAITIYIPDTFLKSLSADRSTVDLMPLLKFRFKVPGIVCHFETEPNLHDDPSNYRLIPPTVEQRDVSFLLNYDNKVWASLVESQQLSQVVILPFLSSDCCNKHRVNVQLVFSEQPVGRRLEEEIKQCYLPDIRRLGLVGVYHQTRLVLGSRLETQVERSRSLA